MLIKNKGFSLIELMVTIAILAFILMMGLPAFSNFLNNSKVRAVAGEMREGLQLARMEAIRRNTTVAFCTTSSSGSGWQIKTASCDGTEIRSKGTVSSETVAVALSPTDLSLSFGGDGRIRLSSGASASGPGLTTLDVSRKNTCSDDCVSMRVEISPGGMIRTCNTNLSAGDPQACTGSSSSSSASSSS